MQFNYQSQNGHRLKKAPQILAELFSHNLHRIYGLFYPFPFYFQSSITARRIQPKGFITPGVAIISLVF
jgi:hypothetical protein